MLTSLPDKFNFNGASPSKFPAFRAVTTDSAAFGAAALRHGCALRWALFRHLFLVLYVWAWMRARRAEGCTSVRAMNVLRCSFNLGAGVSLPCIIHMHASQAPLISVSLLILLPAVYSHHN